MSNKTPVGCWEGDVLPGLSCESEFFMQRKVDWLLCLPHLR